MTLDLTTVNAKLRRSQEHLQTIKDIILSGLKADNYRAVKKSNADSTRYGVFISVKKEFPFEDLSLMIGDCIHNLRSTLDHLVYVVSIHESGSNPPPRHDALMFPIAFAPVNFSGGKDRIKTLSDPVRTVIESLQPYNRPHPELPPLLWLLRGLNDADKHRLLQVAITTPYESSLGSVRNVPLGQKYEVSFNIGSIKEGTEVAALIFDRPTPNVTYEWEGHLIVALRHEKGPRTDISEVRTLIRLLTEEVRFVVDSVVKAVK